jgi:hypothetical protein
MPTIHEQGAEHLFGRMLDHPGASRTLAETRRRLKLPAGHPRAFDQNYVAAIGQVFRTPPSHWPMEQVAAFTAMHTKICAGEVAQVQISAIGLDDGPSPDAHRDENAAKLADLPAPFQAEVDRGQYGADSDGSLKWNAPIQVDAATGVVFLDACRGAAKQPVTIVQTIADGWAPLEIGSTMPSRTLMHVIQEGVVARWPYGADSIWLFVHRDGPVSPSLPSPLDPS